MIGLLGPADGAPLATGWLERRPVMRWRSLAMTGLDGGRLRLVCQARDRGARWHLKGLKGFHRGHAGLRAPTVDARKPVPELKRGPSSGRWGRFPRRS